MHNLSFNQVMEAGDPEELSQLELAQKVGDALNQSYPNHPWVIGFQGGAGKKIVDYFLEHETWQMCVGKAIVSCLWPLSIWAHS